MSSLMEGCFVLTPTSCSLFRVGMELGAYLKDGVVTDWDMFEKVVDYVYDHSLHGKAFQHPLLMTEPPWNPRNKREKLTELFFEK